MFETNGVEKAIPTKQERICKKYNKKISTNKYNWTLLELVKYMFGMGVKKTIKKR